MINLKNILYHAGNACVVAGPHGVALADSSLLETAMSVVFGTADAATFVELTQQNGKTLFLLDTFGSVPLVTAIGSISVKAWLSGTDAPQTWTVPSLGIPIQPEQWQQFEASITASDEIDEGNWLPILGGAAGAATIRVGTLNPNGPFSQVFGAPSFTPPTYNVPNKPVFHAVPLPPPPVLPEATEPSHFSTLLHPSPVPPVPSLPPASGSHPIYSVPSLPSLPPTPPIPPVPPVPKPAALNFSQPPLPPEPPTPQPEPPDSSQPQLPPLPPLPPEAPPAPPVPFLDENDRDTNYDSTATDKTAPLLPSEISATAVPNNPVDMATEVIEAIPSLASIVIPGQPTIELNETVLMGREPKVEAFPLNVPLRLIKIESPNSEISRSHCAIVKSENGSWGIVDLHSSNGTRIVRGNQSRAIVPMELIPLFDEDIIDLGDCGPIIFHSPGALPL